ncbi:MAG: hypothetical protein IIX08_09065 [Bacteroidales bacterium]|nr:hypothetical protein [Bacteroidales bacterium]
MADNYLEKKYEALQERKAKEQRAKQIAWKKRMDAYRKKLEQEKQAAMAAGMLEKDTAPQTQENPADRGE